MAEDLPPVTFGVKVLRDDRPHGHVAFALYAGAEHARGLAGQLKMRSDEFESFIARLQPEVVAREIWCCDRPNVVWEHSRDSKDFFRCHNCRGVVSKPRRVVRDGG